jgi:hypothetical protein
MRRIYIAGKLNDDAVGYLQNVSKMVRVAIEVQRAGFSVFVPCLDLLCGIVAGDFTYDDYALNNIKWLEVSDAVYVLPDSENSKGTQKEIALANSLDIPVFHDLEMLKNWRC